MKRLVVLAAVVFAASSAIARQEPAKAVTPAAPAPAAVQAQDLPSAESLFEKHIAAIGGWEVLKAERNRLVRGKYTVPTRSIEGTLRIMRSVPDKIMVTLEIPGLMTQETWCNAEGAWIRDSNSGTKRVQGERLAELRLQAEFLGEANYKARYAEITTVAKEAFEGTDAYVVLAKTKDGKSRKVYFDAGKGLIVGFRTLKPESPETEPVVVLADYTKFENILHPTRQVTKIGGVEQGILTVTKVESNLTVLPTVDPPDEVRAVN